MGEVMHATCDRAGRFATALRVGGCSSTGSRGRGFTASRVHGFAGSRGRGVAGSRVHGFVGSRLRGFAGSRVRRFAGSRLRRLIGPWRGDETESRTGTARPRDPDCGQARVPWRGSANARPRTETARAVARRCVASAGPVLPAHVYAGIGHGTGRGTRTLTGLRPADFKSAASAVPPSRPLPDRSPHKASRPDPRTRGPGRVRRRRRRRQCPWPPAPPNTSVTFTHGYLARKPCTAKPNRPTKPAVTPTSGRPIHA